jgi:intracellular septation protein
MIEALRQLAEDFLSTILFFAVYALSGNLYAAVAVAVAVGLAQLFRLKHAGRPVEPMQWMSLALVVVFGVATVLLQTPLLMMLKPSVIHLAIAAVMLRRGWMLRYLPRTARENLPESIVVAAGYAWAALLVALALANLVVALNFDIATWAWFVTLGAGGAKLAALLVQYAVFRAVVRSRLRGGAVAAAGP